MQGTDKLNTITNIVFVLTDVLETNLLEMQQKYKKEGFELRHDSKRNFNTAIAAIKRLKSDVIIVANPLRKTSAMILTW